MQYVNRITGTTQSTPPQSFLLGQWQLITDQTPVKFDNISLPKQSRLYLLGNKNHRINLEGENQEFNTIIPRWQLSEEIVAESIRAFQAKRANLINHGNHLDQWLKIPPLIPDIQDKIQLQPLTQDIAKNLKHLEEICRRPRTYLKMETEKLPVSRAKRISKHAVSFLSAHPEDWERVKMQTVIPKNVLSLVREELLNLYENRVVARLIDHLLDYINRRIQDVKAIKQELDEASNFSSEIEDIFYLNSRRVCSLWGDYVETDMGSLEAEETLKQLQSIQYKLRGLISTPLYQAIPRQATIKGSLKRTNILVHDQHYRYVDQLWRKWSQWKSQNKKTTEQFFQDGQKFCEGFESFCLLLISRALMGNDTSDDKGFSFQPRTNCIPKKDGSPSYFQGVFGEITMTWNPDGTFLLTDHVLDKRPLKIIPVISNLKTANCQDLIDTIQDEIEEQTSLTNPETPYYLILYPGIKEERQHLSFDLQNSLYTLGSRQFPDQSLVGFLPVTPLDIFSVERIARGIQWWLNGQRYQAYPQLISLQHSLPNQLLSFCRCLKRSSNNYQFWVKQFPHPEEKQSYEKELERMINQSRSQGRNQRGELQNLEAIKNMNLWEKIEEAINPLVICPVCHHPDNQNNFRALETGCFSCFCNQCGSEWGTKMSSQFNRKYPYIELNHAQIISTPEEIDRAVGRDIIALS